jgi:hypothetical protein
MYSFVHTHNRIKVMKKTYPPCSACQSPTAFAYSNSTQHATKCTSCGLVARTNPLTGSVILPTRRTVPKCPVCNSIGAGYTDSGNKRWVRCKGVGTHSYVVYKDTMTVVTDHKPRAKNGEGKPYVRPSRAKHPPRIPTPSKPTKTNSSKTKRDESVKIFQETKTCSKCNEQKPVIHFRHYKSGLYPQCKHCENLKASKKTVVIDNYRLKIEARRDLMGDVDPLFA